MKKPQTDKEKPQADGRKVIYMKNSRDNNKYAGANNGSKTGGSSGASENVSGNGSNNSGQSSARAQQGRTKLTVREKKIILILFAAIAFYFVIARFDALKSGVRIVFQVIRPILIGFVMAFLMNPMMGFMESHILSFLEKKRKKQTGSRGRKWIRTITVILSAIILVGLVAAFFSFVAPQFVEAIQNLRQHLNEKIIGVIDWADELTRYQFTEAMQDAKSSGKIEEGISSAMKWLTDYLKVDVNDSQQMIFTGISVGTDVIMLFVNILIALFLAIYMLLCKESYKGHIKRLMYAVMSIDHANLVLDISRKAGDIFYGFIIGKIIDSAIIGVICFFSMLIMRMPYALLCSFVVGVTNIIPVFGPYIGAVPTVILIFVTDPPKGIMFLIYILILQQVDGNLIGPKILGDSTGITSFWVIVAVVVGGSLFGFMGMLIGVPTLALILYIIDRVAQYRTQKKHLPSDPRRYIDVDHIDKDTKKVYFLEETKD